MGKFNINSFNNFDDLDINAVQAVISNQEIAYNQLLNNPKGILRTSYLGFDMLIASGRTAGPANHPNISVPDNIPTKITVLQLTYSDFDLTRVYRVRAISNLIRGIAGTLGAMDIIDDLGRHIRSANFVVPQPPMLSGLFRPTKTTHTFTWRASTCKSNFTTQMHNLHLNPYQSYTIDNTSTGRSCLYLEDMGVYIAGNGPQN